MGPVGVLDEDADLRDLLSTLSPTARDPCSSSRSLDSKSMPASQIRLLSVDVASYLRISHQRVYQMLAEGKLPTPRHDHLGASWTARAIERWAELHWWGTKPWRTPRR
jgi:predicted DNA-binding transcriptional regulator AlpA